VLLEAVEIILHATKFSSLFNFQCKMTKEMGIEKFCNNVAALQQCCSSATMLQLCNNVAAISDHVVLETALF